MTPAFAALREIAAGRLPADNALLQNCRLEGFGARVFGREPILDLFRRSPINLSETAAAVESPRALLVVQGDQAIFADLHEGRFTRLWALGDETLGAPEPSVSVPRDLDLSQFDADVLFDPADHPDLESSGAATISCLTRPDSTAALLPQVFSRRTFVVRTFSNGGRTASLMVCAGALEAIARKPFSVNVALLSEGSMDGHVTSLVVVDQAGFVRASQSAWTPRL